MKHKLDQFEARIHRLMDRMGASRFTIEVDRPHWRSARCFRLLFDLGYDGRPDWRRVGYVQDDRWQNEFLGAFWALLLDAEDSFERELARTTAERIDVAVSKEETPR